MNRMETKQLTDNDAAGKAKMLREAQKRLTWIDNVKRKLGYSQEQAEVEWAKIFNPNQPQKES